MWCELVGDGSQALQQPDTNQASDRAVISWAPRANGRPTLFHYLGRQTGQQWLSASLKERNRILLYTHRFASPVPGADDCLEAQIKLS